MLRTGGEAVNLLHRLVQIGRSPVGEEGNDGLAAQIIGFEKSADDHRRLVPPAGRTDEDRVIPGDCFRSRQVRNSGSQVVVCLAPDTVAVIVGIRGIRVGRHDTVYVRSGEFRDAFGYALRVARRREIGNQDIAVPCRLVGDFRIGNPVVRRAGGQRKEQERDQK